MRLRACLVVPSDSGRSLRGTPACKSSGPPRGEAAARRSLRDRFCLREACSRWSWCKYLSVKSVAVRPAARSRPRAEGCNSRSAGPLMHARPLGCGAACEGIDLAKGRSRSLHWAEVHSSATSLLIEPNFVQTKSHIKLLLENDMALLFTDLETECQIKTNRLGFHAVFTGRQRIVQIKIPLHIPCIHCTFIHGERIILGLSPA